MSDLTPRQRQILKMIQDSIVDNGMPPTRAEIAAAMGFKSPNAAEEHLRALQRKGVLDLLPGASRGIQLKDSLREQMGLPLIGRVAAGRPMLAEEHIEARYQLDPIGRRRSSRFFVFCFSLLLAVVVAFMIAVPVLVIVALFKLF